MPSRRWFVPLILGTGLAAVTAPAPQAQVGATSYTFTPIANHHFLQVVEGAGTEAHPQRVLPGSQSLDDTGEVGFAHALDVFELARTVISRWSGAIAPVYGGGALAPLALTGIAGDGDVFLVDGIFARNHDGDPCAPFAGMSCLFNLSRSFAVPVNGSRVSFVVNGAHPRLRQMRPGPAARLAYWEVDDQGLDRISTDLGMVAASPDVAVTSFQTPDVNTAGEVVFLAAVQGTTAIVAGRPGGPLRTVFVNDGRFGVIFSPKIDDSGRVFFAAAPQGFQQLDLYRVDAAAEQPILLLDSNAGPLVLAAGTQFSVNAAGMLAFLATRGVGGPAGIYTGPDPIADKVIEEGDAIGARAVSELRLAERAINNNGLAGRGQILFSLRLAGDDGYSLYRADPPGTVAENPYLPLEKVAGTYRFAKTRPPCAGGTLLFVDPPFAIGYEYTLGPGSPNFESVLPPALPGQDTYDLELWNGTEYVPAAVIAAGVEHRFASGGVNRFRLMGIAESLELDVDDPTAFVTGLRFVSDAELELSMTPIAAVPPPIDLVWPTPAAIEYGTALGPAQLNATTETAGTFAYSPAAGTVLDAGTHTLSVTFAPADAAREPVVASVTLTVLPARLTIRADDKTMVAGDPLPPLTATYVGFVNGDTPASLDTAASLSTTATGTTVGTFPIEVAGASDINYAVSFVAGSLTVRARDVRCLGEPDRSALWPINPDGTSVFRKGTSVLVRFRACNASGRSIDTPGFVRSLALVSIEPGTAVDHVNELPLLLPPTGAFHWNPWLQEWYAILPTRTLAPLNTYRYRVALGDGSSIEFRFGVR